MDNFKEKLVKNYGWSYEQIELAIRANCKCEYCDKDMFLSADNYKLWEVDHIIPKSCGDKSFDYEKFENKSIACRQCNVSYKSKYNPASEIGYNKNREDYIFQIRKYVLEKREENNLKLRDIKELFAQIQEY